MSVVWLRLHLRLRSLLFDFSYMRVLCGSAVRLLSFFCCLLFAPHVGAFASVEATTPRTPFSIICKINLHTSIFCSTFAVGNRKPRRAVLHIFLPASGRLLDTFNSYTYFKQTKNKYKNRFFHCFFGFSVFTLHHPPWCIGTSQILSLSDSFCVYTRCCVPIHRDLHPVVAWVIF